MFVTSNYIYHSLALNKTSLNPITISKIDKYLNNKNPFVNNNVPNKTKKKDKENLSFKEVLENVINK